MHLMAASDLPPDPFIAEIPEDVLKGARTIVQLYGALIAEGLPERRAFEYLLNLANRYQPNQ